MQRSSDAGTAFVDSADQGRMLDLTMGLGSLLFGHDHPELRAAVQQAAHVGWWRYPDAYDQTSVRAWLATISSLVPSADAVHPTASASEANQLALRLARSVTGREYVIRFQGHYHGNFDEALTTGTGKADGSGLHPLAGSRVMVVDETDLNVVEDYLNTRRVAAVILEPGGGAGGLLPSDPERLRWLRSLTDDTGTALIFDEAITAFRFGPGGVQAEAGVIPDMCTLSKVLTGGLPGGALVGSRRFMSPLDESGDALHAGPAVASSSTFAGHPVTAAAGLASLRLAADGQHQLKADRNAERLCLAFNETARSVESRWRVFRTRSILHIAATDGAEEALVPSRELARQIQRDGEGHRRLAETWRACRVIAHPHHMWISSAHDERVHDHFTEAARAVLTIVEAGRREHDDR